MSDLVKRLCRPGYDLQKEQAIQEAIIEIRELRAKIAEREKQEPFDADSDAFRSAFEAALKAGNWPMTRQGDGYRSPSTQIAWRIAFSTVNRLKLYLAPGAQPAPSGEDDAVRKSWARFSNELHRSPGAPYPGMSEAFERHFSQSFTDREWRSESATWAAAWKAAKNHGAHPAPSVPDDIMRDAMRYRFLRAARSIPISTQAARDPVVYDEAIDRAMLAAAPEAKP